MDEQTVAAHIKLLQGRATPEDQPLVAVPDDLSSAHLSTSNPELRALTTPAQLKSKSSFAGRMNDVHVFAVGQTQLNRVVIEQYEALSARVAQLESSGGTGVFVSDLKTIEDDEVTSSPSRKPY